MDPYLSGALICGVILLGVIGLMFGVGYFTNNEQDESNTEQTAPSNTVTLTIPASPPQITNTHNLRTITIPPNADYEEIEKFKQEIAEEENKISSYQTVKYGGMTFRTDELELQIHELINVERMERGLNPLEYDNKMSNIARRHSIDMSADGYFGHENQEGKGPRERGQLYDYKECGDRETIQLKEEYDLLLKQFELTGNTDAGLYNQLEKMNIQINSAIQQGMVFDGLSENISQNNLYDQYWTTNGVITSYDWNSPEEIAKTTVEGWMNSERHRENILTLYYKSEGIGINVDSDSKVLITQNLC